MEMNLEEMKDEEAMECEVDCEKEVEDCGNRCCEMGEKSMTKDRAMMLELEIEKKKSEYELLQTKFRALEAEKAAIEDELRALKRRNEVKEHSTNTVDRNKVDCGREQGIEGIIDLTQENDEEEKIVEVMIENNVLELEKTRAESEVEAWKKKYEALESWALQLEKSLALRNRQHPLSGKAKLELGLLNVDSDEGIVTKEVNDTVKAKDGSDVGGDLDHLQTKVQMVHHDKPYSAAIHSSCKSPGTPSIDAQYKYLTHPKGEKKAIHLDDEVEYGRRVRKQLSFEEECSNKKMAPSTPAGAGPASVGVIHISDNDDEPDIMTIKMPTPEIQGINTVCVSADHASGITVDDGKEMTSENSLKKTISYQSDGEDLSGCKGNVPFVSTPKRKKRPNIVTSDSESDGGDDDDDKVPTRKFKRLHLGELICDPTSSHLNSCSTSATVSGVDCVRGALTPPKRRLMTLRECEKKGRAETNLASNLNARETENQSEILTNEDVEASETEEVGSDSEGESLGGFIINDSEVSGGDGASCESEEESNGNVDFVDIISRIRRNSDKKSKWEFEADMLAAFGKDPELCMKAVCALYRQQTSEEKTVKETIYSNQRGFSQCDALRGTTLAEYLTDGDPQGDLKKSVKDLQQYHPKALELCRTLATHYSKQLFAIYQNKEDPFFLSS